MARPKRKASVKAPAKKTPAKRAKTVAKKKKTLVPQWEWKGGASWTPYAKDDSEMLEDKHEAGFTNFTTQDLTFNRSGTDYVFDLKHMSQLNSETHKTRKIRRVLAPPTSDTEDEDDDDDDDDDDDTGGYGKVLRKISSIPKGKKVKPIKKLGKLPGPLPLAEIKAQAALGAQSKRSFKPKGHLYGASVSKDKHGTYCFDRMLQNEARLSGEYAVMYHSYSFAALLYEVQAAVAAVLFRFKSTFASLPRLLKEPYNEISDAAELMKAFPKFKDRDHNVKYRSVAICGTTSLLATDMEAPPTTCFLGGYSCADVSFRKVLEDLLTSCYVPKKQVKKLSDDIIKLSEKHGLDVSQFGGKRCKSGKPGHLLQIFMKRELLDKFVYAALPYGVIDKPRMPISKALSAGTMINGQIRLVCHPSIMMRASAVRMYVYSADATFHEERETFQEELTQLLKPILGNDKVRVKAATGIHGGDLPPWFDSKDQSHKAKIPNSFK